MKKMKLLVVVASLFLVNNASANTLNIEMNTDFDEKTTQVLNKAMLKINNELFIKMEEKNEKMMDSLQEKMDVKMSFLMNDNVKDVYIVENLYQIHADEVMKNKEKYKMKENAKYKMKENAKYKDKKYLCNKKTNTTSI
jgi:hypothetical protein